VFWGEKKEKKSIHVANAGRIGKRGNRTINKNEATMLLSERGREAQQML
jgi:hypothetical protein